MKRIILLVLIASLFVLNGCGQEISEKVSAYQENNEIIGPERDEIIGEISDTIYEEIDRSNSEAEELFVSPITAPGEDVVLPEGRYSIAAAPVAGSPSSDGMPQSGTVSVYDEDGVVLLNEILGGGQGVSGVTVDVNGSHTVHLDGVDEAIITPVPTELSNELSAGIWEVGKDIEAGSYSVVAVSDFAFGDLQIFEQGKPPRLYEFLNISQESDSKINVQLTDGQKLKISGLSYLEFTPDN